MAQCLLAHGASATAANDRGITPLHEASQSGHLPVAQCLLAHGASATAANIYGNTPLHWASQNGHLAMVQCLLAHGASATAANNYGITPLHWASQNEHLAVAGLLNDPPPPDFTPPPLQHLTSFVVWRSVGQHIDRLRALFDGSLPPMLLIVILVELGFEASNR